MTPTDRHYACRDIGSPVLCFAKLPQATHDGSCRAIRLALHGGVLADSLVLRQDRTVLTCCASMNWKHNLDAYRSSLRLPRYRVFCPMLREAAHATHDGSCRAIRLAPHGGVLADSRRQLQLFVTTLVVGACELPTGTCVVATTRCLAAPWDFLPTWNCDLVATWCVVTSLRPHLRV